MKNVLVCLIHNSPARFASGAILEPSVLAMGRAFLKRPPIALSQPLPLKKFGKTIIFVALFFLI